MTETQRDPIPGGPYRRQPPTIDAVPVPAAPPEVHPAAATAETAIEPMAAISLDPAPSTKDAPSEGDAPFKGESVSDGKTLSEDGTPADLASVHHSHIDAQGSARLAAELPAGDGAASETGPASGEPRSFSSVPPVGGTRGPPERVEPRRSGVGALLATGLLGGVIGAGLAVGADYVLHPPVRDVDARVAALENRSRPAPAPDLAPLDRRLGALEVQNRDLVAKLAAASAATGVAGGAADAKPAAAPDPALRQDLAALSSRVDAADATLRSVPTPEALNEIRTRLDALGTGGEERFRAGAAAVAALQTTTAALDQRVKTQGDELGRLPPSLMAAGLRAIVAAAVGDDLRAGIPLRSTLAALEKLDAGSQNLDALRPFADKAAPGAPALAAEFKPIAERITAEPGGAKVSLGDRLMRMADKVVSVRAVGDGSGNDLPGIVGRIDAALNRGDLPAAAASVDRLPDAAKAQATDWTARLKARVAADAAAARIKADALAALDKSPR